MTSVAQTQLAEDAQSTADAQATADAVAATAAAEATASAESANATATQVMAMTATKMGADARNTETAATRQAGTEQAIEAATAQAQPMADLLASLQADGYLVETAGEYTLMPDHSMEQAKLNYLDGFPLFIEPSNFVVRVDIAYSSASTTADWWNSSCGFLFRMDPEPGNFYQAVLSLDGRVEFKRWKNGSATTLTNKFFGSVDTPDGAFEMVLVVEDTWTTILIDGVEVVRYSDQAYTEGQLWYTLTSGTNKDYGTRCSFTNTEIWTLD
jgi:hypothetical protein